MKGDSPRPSDASGIVPGSSDRFDRTSSGLWVPEARPTAAELDLELRAPYVISEIESSLSFVNIEFVVCTALLLTNRSSLVEAPMAGIALLIAFVFFLFSGLCFAVAGGEVARGPKGISAARTALEWGNVLSEWFGLYMLLLALPAVVQLATGSSIAGGIATGIAAMGYAVYVLSGYDLMGRFVRSVWRWIGHGLFYVLVTAHWLGVALPNEWFQFVAGGLFIALTTWCATIHRRRGEFS